MHTFYIKITIDDRAILIGISARHSDSQLVPAGELWFGSTSVL